MFNKIVDFVFEKEKNNITPEMVKESIEHIQEHQVFNVPIHEVEETIELEDLKFLEFAKNHYCKLCNRFFKTKGATNAHKTLKHGK